jgi:hypothetical protein
MKVTSEFCPMCNAIRSTVMTSTGRVVTDPDGKKKIKRTTHIHCEICHSFIRNEDLDEKESAL